MRFGRPGLPARPEEDRFAEGHLAVGVIEEGPSEVQGPDTLVISADTPQHGVLRRRVICPLSISGSGRRLVGQSVGFRHVTHDPDDLDDVLVVRWPEEVRKALEPLRLEGPGAGRARAWRLLAQCSAVVSALGILLTAVMLIGVVFTAGELFADLPAWFRPGTALAASAGAAMLGPFAFAFCDARARRTGALSHPFRRGPATRPRS
ncbi:hypothetical protein [Streptomyces sp. NPDC017556]|uniref:hypothetical protein n=1 Tax=Streptomyces sp. NPDC017556 TaxID=3365002 RepID=UPI00379A5649